jgi:hypothetical protein
MVYFRSNLLTKQGILDILMVYANCYTYLKSIMIVPICNEFVQFIWFRRSRYVWSLELLFRLMQFTRQVAYLATHMITVLQRHHHSPSKYTLEGWKWWYMHSIKMYIDCHSFNKKNINTWTLVVDLTVIKGDAERVCIQYWFHRASMTCWSMADWK